MVANLRLTRPVFTFGGALGKSLYLLLPSSEKPNKKINL